MGGNGHEEEKVKKCPFGLECDECRLAMEMVNTTNGIPQKYLMCSIVANVTILSELNAKTVAPQQKINLPPGNLFRG